MFLKRSLRVRLALIFVLFFGVMLTVFSALLFRSFKTNNQALFDAELYNQAVDVSETVDVDMFGEVRISQDPLVRRGKAFLFAIGKTMMQVRALDGKILARSNGLENGELPFDDEDRLGIDRVGYNFRTISKDRMRKIAGTRSISAYRAISYVVQRFPSNRYVLQLAVPMNILERSTHSLLLFFMLAIPAALVLSAFGGLFFSGRALAPVNSIITKASALSHANLSERLPVPPQDDEIRRLTLTLNGLLERLEVSFKAQERFVSDASHELRTPLAILRGELDLMRSKTRCAEEVDAFVDSASHEIERLSRLVEDLLVLARADIGKTFFTKGRVRLDELTLEVASKLKRIADRKGIKIRLDLSSSTPDFEVRGDADLLFSLLRNLIENAIKYSPQNGIVTVQLIEDEKSVRLRVSDQGEGIASDTLPRIFDRFYRGAKASNEEGFGLGLAIVKQIVDVHQAALRASSAPGSGTTIEVDQIKKV